MYTLKMKVLLLIINKGLHRAILEALLIWMATCVTGCLVLYGMESLLLPIIKSIMLSLVFSSPALLVAVVLLYRLTLLPLIFHRITISIGVIVLTSLIVSGVVAVFFKLRFFEVTEALVPFIPPALAWFFLISRKKITSKQTWS